MIGKPIESIAQTFWVNLPFPFRSLYEVIFNQIFSLYIVEVRVILSMGVNSKGHVVAKANIVNRARQQIFLILLAKVHLDSFSFPVFENMLRILTKCMHICKVIALLHSFHSHENILWIASSRINRAHGNHTTDLEVRIDFVTNLNCTR